MGVSRTLSIALTGLNGTIVEVEADVASGLPNFSIVGLPDSSMLQARERVRAAADHVGPRLSQGRITVNLTPAYQKKHGSGFDLAIAMAVLGAQADLDAPRLRQTVHLGELGLDGQVRPIPGVLPSLLAARRLGIEEAVVPLANADEARLVEGLRIIPAADLTQVLRLHGYQEELRPPTLSTHPHEHARLEDGPSEAVDFRDVVGQEQARRAAEVAAAGGHHLLLSGPPGAGKTMIAARIPGVLPPLGLEDSLSLSAIRSVGGTFDASDGLVRGAPFESPHHSATPAAIVGGGAGLARPGAISRAHAGVLFLDEAPEFPSRVLEALREPLETGDITLHRARGVTRYPARFQLVLAANPCPCGNAYGKGNNCTCTPMQRRRYHARLSGPVLDRIDMRVVVGAVETVPSTAATGEESAVIADRVAAARNRQIERFAGEEWSLNSQIPGAELRGRYAPDRSEARMLDHAVAHGRLTLRGHDRVLRVAWSLADLEGLPRPTAEHIGHALNLRGANVR